MICVAVWLMLGSAARAGAQQKDTAPIDTDRPDFTDATTTVPRHRVQLEAGYTYQQGRGPQPSHFHSLPEALARIGLGTRIELRVGQNYLAQTASGVGAQASRGFDDLYLGTKIHLLDQSGIRPAISTELGGTLPTGAAAISAHRFLPSVALLFGVSTGGPWALGAKLEGDGTSDLSGQLAASISAQYTASRLVQLFAGWWTFQPLGSGTTSQHYADTGVQLLLTNDFALDARIGLGLNSGADRFLGGVGFAVRW